MLAFSALHAAPPQLSETRLLRFPTTNGEQIVFSYAGQLYTVGMAGGTARRLTDGPGYAIFPRFSNDGRQLAFTAQYDGNTEVYVMPATGGIPQRLTYSATLSRDDLADRMGPNNIVMTWKNKSPQVIFRSRWRSFNPFIGELFSVGLDADIPIQLPVPRGGFVSFSPDDSKIAYNRVFREFRTWKNYRGGMADDIWIYDLKSGEIENITQNEAQDIFPMWASNGKIYFVSERTGRGNLFAYEISTKETTQITHFTDYDVKFPSLGRGGIAFEQAGRIWLLDLASERVTPVPILIREDFVGARDTQINVARMLQDINLSPDAQRLAVTARGDVFTAPARNGPTRNLSRTSGVHERGAAWSPDGKWIAYVSDTTGETELFIRPQDGSGEPTQLTSGADTYYYNPSWSPDSRQLAWSDRKQRLRSVDIETKAVTLIAENPDAQIRDFTWSPDSKWIAWTRSKRSRISQIILTRLADGTALEATDAWFDANSPEFSSDGKWLAFASSRDFNPVYSATEWNHAYMNMERVYLLALAKATASPFAPKSDEVSIAAEAEKPATDAPSKPGAGKSGDGKTADHGSNAKKDPAVVVIDADGLSQRVIGLPVEPSNYGSIRIVGDKVYYRRVPAGPVTGGGGGEGLGAGSRSRAVVAMYNLKDRKETELGNADVFAISRNEKKMLLRIGQDWSLIDTPSGKWELKPDNRIDFSGLEVKLDRHEEWSQIFNESWRQMRDFFYAPNMHGVDWPAQREKYGALLPYVSTRNDLTYLIGEMISELRVGHAYVGGGDRVEAPRKPTGLLGAQISRDAASRAYRIDRILPGENWQTSTRSPLTEMGVNVSEGEYILALNGQSTRDLPNLYAALAGTVGKQVVLRVSKSASEDGARDVTVIPIADEAPLYYESWVQKNIAHVTARSNGRVGYLHIPDMGVEGLNEFVRRFYPQMRREALIVDVRGNGGGNVSPMIAERLNREMVMINMTRNGSSSPNPPDQLVGPKVTLMNEYSASDGDLFPFRFRSMGIGKLIGKRSWGGVVGINGSLPFVDNGTLMRPEFAPYSTDGKTWIIEGHGVEPDIVVDNDPAREFKGEDQQLDKAIDVMLEELKTKAVSLPTPPPFPVKK
ncbi:MAG: PD40 domain-containing protein [Opitutaceae bacterium]|nr:PD40 domain-containing protein [Opitutaceae bacterium]